MRQLKREPGPTRPWLWKNELVVEDLDYDQAFAAARRRVPEGRRILALRVERESVATG